MAESSSDVLPVFLYFLKETSYIPKGFPSVVLSGCPDCMSEMYLSWIEQRPPPCFFQKPQGLHSGITRRGAGPPPGMSAGAALLLACPGCPSLAAL